MPVFPFPRTRLQAVRSEALWVDLALTAATFGLALAVRLPNLMLVPAYTDEAGEVLWGLDITLGRHFPLTGLDSYDGPLFAYLVAGLFRLFGIHAEIPRALALVFGALTVVAVYWLARWMMNRLAGLVAACLALTSPLLVVYLSHFGWSSSLTPFFAMATAAALYAGVTRDKAWLLAMSGLFAALTLQSHPTFLAGLVGLLLWFVTRPTLRQWLSRPAPYFAGGLFVLGYAPVILANAGFGTPILSDAVQRTYAFAPTLDLQEYLRRLFDIIKVAGFYVGGGIGSGTLPMRITAIAAEIALLIGLVFVWRGRNRLIPTVFVTSLLLIPLFVLNESYRYYSYIIPMSYVVLGILTTSVMGRLWDMRRQAGAFQNLRRPALAVCAIVLAGFTFFSLYNLSEFYRDAFAGGMTNADYFRLAVDVQNDGACGSNLFVQAPAAGTLESPETVPTAFAYENVDFALTLGDCVHSLLDRGLIVQQLSNPGRSGWVIASAVDIEDYKQRLVLSPVSTIHPTVFTTTTPISLYRVEPLR